MKQLSMGTGLEKYARATPASNSWRRWTASCRGRSCVPHRTALPQGRLRAPAEEPGNDAAHLLPAALVQALRPRGGGRALRLARHAPLCRQRSGRGAGPGRDHHLPLPPPAGSPPAPPETHRAGAPSPRGPGHPDSQGAIVDATIISAPSSTENRENKRDPDMHQTRKGPCVSTCSHTASV